MTISLRTLSTFLIHINSRVTIGGIDMDRNNYLLLRNDFRIDLVISPTVAVLA